MRKASLHVAIVGGGIGGLAAANALHQRNVEVSVYEQAPALTEVGAGLALQPNGIRVLRHLGFAEDVARRGGKWVDPQFRNADGLYAASIWPAEIADFYGMHRADRRNAQLAWTGQAFSRLSGTRRRAHQLCRLRADR